MEPVISEVKFYAMKQCPDIYQMGAEYYIRYGHNLKRLEPEAAREFISKEYLTKKFSYEGNIIGGRDATHSVEISDGRSYLHPRSACEHPDIPMCYDVDRGVFITYNELNEIIEDIPLEKP